MDAATAPSTSITLDAKSLMMTFDPTLMPSSTSRFPYTCTFMVFVGSGVTPVTECANANSSLDAWYAMMTFAPGRFMRMPRSTEVNVLLFARSMTVSLMIKSVVLTIVVAPRTSRLPMNTVFGAVISRFVPVDSILGVVTFDANIPVSARDRMAITSPLCVTKTFCPTDAA